MLFGIGLPQRAGFDLRKDLLGLAEGAEREGFSSLWVYDRLLFPSSPKDGLYGVEGLPWIEAYRQAGDSLTLLAAVAGKTESIRLGTSVLVASLHHPLQTAKALTTLDHVSGGGRLIAGFGSGWSVDERRAVGTELGRPGAMLDETLDVLEAAWGPDPVTYSHPRGAVDDAFIGLKPRAPIPVLLGGGHTPVARRRIARRAQGWMATGETPAVAGATWRRLTEDAAQYGRSPQEMRFVYRANMVILDEPLPEAGRFPFVGDMEQIHADTAAVAAAGADEIILEFQLQEPFPADADSLLSQAMIIRERALNSAK